MTAYGDDACRRAVPNIKLAEYLCAVVRRVRNGCGHYGGGPLVMQTERMVQLGVYGSGYRCRATDIVKPDLYVRVTNYVKWILDNMRV